MTPKIRVAIAEDYELVGHMIQGLLDATPTLEVVAVVATGEHILQACYDTRPQVLLLDVVMPELDVEALITALYDLFPRIQIVIFTIHNDAAVILRLLQLDIAGYLVKDESIADLSLAIETVAGGGTWFSPTVQHLRANMTSPSDTSAV